MCLSILILGTLGGKSVRCRKEALFSDLFPERVLLMLVGEGSCSWFFAPVCSYKFYAQFYLHSSFTVPPIGGAFGIQSSICSGAFLQKW